jgi:hypothetical protein
MVYIYLDFSKLYTFLFVRLLLTRLLTFKSFLTGEIFCCSVFMRLLDFFDKLRLFLLDVLKSVYDLEVTG